MQQHNSGPGNTAEYQASALPWVSASTANSANYQISFPYLTRFVIIKNNGPGIINVGFTQNGLAGQNYFTLATSGSFSAELRVKDLFYKTTSGTTSIEIVAGLTMIERKFFPTLTASSAAGVAAAGASLPSWGYSTGLG